MTESIAATVTDVKDAVGIAKRYVQDVMSEENVSLLGLEETEFDRASGGWKITVGFSRPWHAPRTRAQEVLEQLGAASSLRRTFKVVEIASDGTVLSMKDRRE